LIKGLDHVVVLVADLDRTEADFRRLGFAPTPRGLHPKLGTHNHCFMLDGDYFEILGVREPMPSNAPWRAMLEGRQGLAAIALQTDDARADAAALAAAGVRAGEAVDFARPVDTDGVRGDARFTVVHVDPSDTPGTRMFFCQQHTPELVWTPTSRVHPNGARRIREVSAVAADPAALAPTYERLLGAGAVVRSAGEIACRLGRAALRFLSPDAFAARHGRGAEGLGPPFMASMTVEVADPGAAAEVLASAGVRAERAGGALRIDPADAGGVLLILEGPG
jgi:catechol 2,3-dioxygenase-like lactoylglutathione lyase family enzyme